MTNAERRLIIDKLLGTHVELSAVKHIPEGKKGLELLEYYLTNYHKTLNHHSQVLHLFSNLADCLALLELTLPQDTQDNELLDSMPRTQQVQIAINDARRKYEEHDSLARYGEAHGLTYQQRMEQRQLATDIKKDHAYRIHECLEQLEGYLSPATEV